MRIAAPLFIPATKEGRLATRLRAEEEILGTIMGWKYKVVERGGDSSRSYSPSLMCLVQRNVGGMVAWHAETQASLSTAGGVA